MRWQLFTIMLVGFGIFLGSPVLADDLSFKWVEGLIRRADPASRELSLLDYRSGLSSSGLQVPGSVDLRQFKVGDHVLARVGVNNHLILHIRKVPPPTGDKRYKEALRRLQTERGEPFDSGNIDPEGTFRHTFVSFDLRAEEQERSSRPERSAS